MRKISWQESICPGATLVQPCIILLIPFICGMVLVADTGAAGLPSHNIGRGVPACAGADVIIAPFNDLDVMENLMDRHKDRLAALIVEPIMGAGGLMTCSSSQG